MQRFLTAFARGDWTAACDQLSSTLRAQIIAAARQGTLRTPTTKYDCPGALAQAEKTSANPTPTAVRVQAARGVSFSSINVTGDHATVTASSTVSGTIRTLNETLVREGGGWKLTTLG